MKFILLYKGPATPIDELSPEQTQKVNAGWQDWMDQNQAAIIDIGAPMANGQAITDDGSDEPADQLNGYSIIEADDIDEAMEAVSDHPFLADQTGDFSIEVFELQPRPM